MTPIRLAAMFFEAREKLAPYFGFDYNPGTVGFNALTPHGRFLIAVCEEVLDQIDFQQTYSDAESDEMDE